MVLIKGILLKQEQMKEVLVEFSHEVFEGRCEKIPYSYWKTLKEAKLVGCYLFNNSDNTQEIRLTNEEYDEIIVIYDLNTEKPNFGDFIYERKFNENRKENKEMNNNTFNFDFGVLNNDNIHMSPYGIAVKNKDSKWVSYDANSGKVIDVNIFNFNGNNMFYKIPVAIKDIKVGDVIIHQRVPMYVINDITDNKVIVIDPMAGEEKIVLPTTSPFGFDFVTKIVSIMDMCRDGVNATAETPFGNMLPFLLMNNSEEEIDPMMLLMLNQQNNSSNMFSNPMMLYCLCGKSSDKNLLPLMMMMNMNK